ncbi:MAG TPA: PQQ-binding-like beta-propeller repeat protein, partial [Planctomycetota bacterium]|nr:PQQ-binding-like beta-propeller repeat protein [Planctomycetota bacterium]
MTPHVRLLLLVLCSLPLVAADLAWPANHDGNQLPTGWEAQVSENASVHFANGDLLLQAPPNRFALVSRDLGTDGTDAKPLVITAAVSSEGTRELGGLPTAIALWWDANNAVLIGLSGMNVDGIERWEPGRRRGWAQWISNGTSGRAATEQQLYSAEASAQVRLVLSSNDVSAAISADGVTWRVLATLPRKDTVLAKPPVRLVVGRGHVGEETDKRRPLLANDMHDVGWKENIATRVADLSVTNGAPALPCARLVSKATGFEDLHDADLDAIIVVQWYLLGPLPSSDKPYGIEETKDISGGLPLVPGQDARWKPYVGDNAAERRILNFKRAAGSDREHQVLYAATVITCESPRWERLWYDGARAPTIFVNGRQVADKRMSWEAEIVPDRYAATVRLAAGQNLVLIRLRSAYEGHCRLAFRHEPAAPLQRIADLTQALGAYGMEGDACVAAWLEIGQWWEVLGQRRLATEALARGLERDGLTGAQVDALSFARARLHGEMRDEPAVIKVVEELARRRLMGEDGDRATTRLNLVRLWERMGFPDRALAAAEDLVKDTTIDVATLAEAGLERARLRVVLKQEAPIPGELRAVAARLPASDPLAFELHLAALRRDRDMAAALFVAGTDRARQARVYAVQASLFEEANDNPGRIAALRKLIAVSDGESTWESLQSELAEALAASDRAGAIAAYKIALDRAPAAAHPAVVVARKAAEAATGDAALGKWRAAAAQAALADSEAGARLLTDALKTPANLPTGDGEALTAPVVTDFHVIGPFPNPDFICYTKPPVNPEKIDLNNQVLGKRWTRPGKEFYRDGILSLSALYNASDCVAFAYRAIAVAVAGDGELLLGADDGLTVWFNGQKVHEDRDNRAVQPGQIRIPVKFTAGTNRILCMVQQGNGDWGLHLRIGGAATGSRGLAEVLAMLEQDARRPRAAEALLEMVGGEVGSDRADEATALARFGLRAFADAPAAQVAMARRLIEERRDRPRLIKDPSGSLRWLLSTSERRAFAGRDEVVRTLPPVAARLLLDVGDAAGAATVLTRQIGTSLDADVRRTATLGLADLYRVAGYPQEAAERYKRLEQRPDLSDEQRQALRDGQQRVRGARADGAAFPVSLDANTLIATGDRALSGGDATRALRSYQRAIDQYGDALLKRDERTLVGVAALVGTKLRALDAAGLDAYRKLSNRRADEALAHAGTDATALGEVAVSYPATGAAASALLRIADLALEAGHGNRAIAALASLAAGNDQKLALQLDARRAYALELSGDRAGAALAYDGLLKQYADVPLMVAGGAGTTKQFVADRKAALASQAGRMSWSTAGGSPSRTGLGTGIPAPAALLSETIMPVALAQQVAAHRFAPSVYHHLSLQPAVVDGAVYCSTDAGVYALNLADGTLRWRADQAAGDPALFAGNHDGTVGVADGIVAARVQRGDVRVIEARDAASGALRWAIAITLGASDAISPPAVTDGLVYAVFNERDNRSRNTLAAFDLRDGTLRWRTPLADGVANLVTATQQEIALGEHLAAPTVAGGEIYVATDMGGVVAADALTGRVHWAATYPRARLDPLASAPLIRRLANRAPRVVVAGETLYVTPRDTLALLAIRRSDGVLRWQQPFSDAHALIGVAGDALFAQGDGITCLDAATGIERWHWRATTLHGVAGLGTGRLYASTSDALVELEAVDGRVSARHAWSELGLATPVGNTIVLGDRLLAVGEDRVVVLGTGDTKTAKRQQVAPAAAAILGSTGLPSAPLVAPLALRWNLDAPSTTALHRVGPVLYADLGDRLVRFSDDGEKLVWSSDSAGEIDALDSAGGLLLALHERALVARRVDDGRVAWTQALSMEDCGFILDRDEERKRERRGAVSLSGDATLVALRPLGANAVSLFDATSGAPRGRIAYSGTLVACEVVGGRVVGVRHVGERLTVDVRSLQGEVVWSEELKASVREPRRVVATLDDARTTLVLMGDHLSACIDVGAKPAVRWQDTPDIGEVPTITFLKDRIAVFARRQGQQWMEHILEASSGRIIASVETQRRDRLEDGEKPILANDRWVSFSERTNNRWSVVCRDLATPDKELWVTDVGERHRRGLVGRAVVGQTLVLVGIEDGRRCSWTTIELANGRVSGTGRIDGIEPAGRDERIDVAALGNLVVCAANRSVVAIGGLPPAPPDPLKAALAKLRQGDATPTADLLLTMQTPPEASALASERAVRVDGQLDEWSGDAAIVLDQRRQVRGATAGAAPWSGTADLSARARVQWDASFVYVAVEVIDDHWQPAVPGADLDDGDSFVLGIDPDPAHDGGEAQPLVVSVALVDGQTRIVQRSGRAAGQLNEDDQPQGDDGQRLHARLICTAAGWSGEIVVPWSSLRVNPSERPGWRTDLGLDLLVVDRDGERRQAIEWGAGLSESISDRRFGRAKCIDLTGERIAGFRKFIDLLGDHPYAWRFTRRIAATHLGIAGIPGRITEIERYVTAQPQAGSTGQALAELVRLRRQAGEADPAATVAAFASKVKVPPRLLGDAIGPSAATGKQGRAIRQWVRIEVERPPLELIMQVRTKDSDWNQRAYWGQDVIQWGEPLTTQRWPM